MFDPQRMKIVAEQQQQQHLTASVGRLTRAQRDALVSLGIGGSAKFFPGYSGYWIIPCLGQSWAIAQTTMDVLVREGWVTISVKSAGTNRAHLTRLGRWYAASAAGREADERYLQEQL